MCPPDHFEIEYEINPWMRQENPVEPIKAQAQWKELYSIYTDQLRWDVELVRPISHLPDMVFTANGALTYQSKVALPHFRHPDRQPETEYFETWFRDAGYTDLYKPKYDFEGEGDALFWNDVLLAGYPWRTDLSAHKELANFFGVKVVSLQLIDARFYHLDTALTIVDEHTIALFPEAFSKASLEALKKIVPQIIYASAQDAEAYGLNAMSDGDKIVIPAGAQELIKTYKSLGKTVFPCPISEFQKSGGGVKCLTLELRQ